MHKRALRVAKGLGVVALVGVVTWLISWLIQFFCAITIPGQRLDVTSHQSSRLALYTVAAAVVVMFGIMLVLEVNGCLLAVIIFLLGGSILSGIGWIAVRTFSGTAVSTLGAQITYGVVVLLWGVLLWYIFLKDVSRSVADIIDELAD